MLFIVEIKKANYLILLIYTKHEQSINMIFHLSRLPMNFSPFADYPKERIYRKGLFQLNPDYALSIVTRVEKPKRKAKLEQFCDAGIFTVIC
jgi:hypothetical protein